MKILLLEDEPKTGAYLKTGLKPASWSIGLPTGWMGCTWR